MSELSKPEQITLESYDHVAAAWNARHQTPKFWGEDFDRFYELLPTGSRLLEIGCGAGRDAQELIAHGYDYVGTDISAGQLEQAKINNPGVEFQQVSAYDLDFKEPFDGFWAAASLIHIPQKKMPQVLQTIKRNLRPAAVGFFAMKEGEGEKLEQRQDLNNSQFLFVYWQREEFADILRSNGFEILSEDYIPFSERSRWLTYIVRSL